jgi:hypothetical protein
MPKISQTLWVPLQVNDERSSENDLVDICFHIEHIIAIKHGGDEDIENLALACDRCNLHKGPNVGGIDQETGQLTPLFHPRVDNWHEHFIQVNSEISGKTPAGRVTVQVLNFNAPRRVLLRQLLSSPE